MIWDYQSLVNKEQQRIILITNAESSFKSQVQAWKSLLLRNEEKYWQEFLSLHKSVHKDLKQLQTFEERDWTTRFINQHQTMLKAYEKAQRSFVLNKNYKQGDTMVRGIDRNFAKGLIDKRSVVTKHFIVTTVNPIMSFFIAIVAIVGILIFIHKAIILPLRDLIDKTVEISNGKYDLHMDYPFNDEVGQLSQAITEIKIILLKLSQTYLL